LALSVTGILLLTSVPQANARPSTSSLVHQGIPVCSAEPIDPNTTSNYNTACYYGYISGAFRPREGTTYCDHSFPKKNSKADQYNYYPCTRGVNRGVVARTFTDAQLNTCGKYLKFLQPGESIKAQGLLSNCLSNLSKKAPPKPAQKPAPKKTSKPKSTQTDPSSPATSPAFSEDPAIKCDQSSCDLIAKYVNPAIDLFSLCFGLIAVISLIAGGIQYSASQGDPQKTAQAKSRITNTILAIFAYLFLYAFLQFLVPGGAFH